MSRGSNVNTCLNKLEVSLELVVEVLKKLSDAVVEAGGLEMEADGGGASSIGQKLMAVGGEGWVEDEH